MPDRPYQIGSLLLIDDGTAWPVLPSEEDYGALEAIEDRSIRYRIRRFLEAYAHLAGHPAGTESAIGSLRSLRRAVKACPSGGDRD